MGMQTFLGPILAGTQKNTDASKVVSNTPSATYLQPGTGGSYRNTGASDHFQFVTVPKASLTGLSALSGTAQIIIPTYAVSGVNYPVVIPAGSYIDNIDFIVNTVPTFSGTPTSASIDVQLIGAPGTTYATAQAVATVTLTAASLPTIGVYATANSSTTASATNPIVYTASATPLAMIQNVGPSDVMLQLSVTGSGGTTPKFTDGAFALAVNYVVRNPDGSWYPQTPPVPYSTPTPATY